MAEADGGSLKLQLHTTRVVSAYIIIETMVAVNTCSGFSTELNKHYLNVEIFVVTGGKVSSELQNCVSTFLLPTDQKPVLT